MVELTKQLMAILDLRKDDFTGGDIKSLVESIAISESMAVKVDKRESELANKALMDEWVNGGVL